MGRAARTACCPTHFCCCVPTTLDGIGSLSRSSRRPFIAIQLDAASSGDIHPSALEDQPTKRKQSCSRRRPTRGLKLRSCTTLGFVDGHRAGDRSFVHRGRAGQPLAWPQRCFVGEGVSIQDLLPRLKTSAGECRRPSNHASSSWHCVCAAHFAV